MHRFHCCRVDHHGIPSQGPSSLSEHSPGYHRAPVLPGHASASQAHTMLKPSPSPEPFHKWSGPVQDKLVCLGGTLVNRHPVTCMSGWPFH